jgi:hypothetical protein
MKEHETFLLQQLVFQETFNNSTSKLYAHGMSVSVLPLWIIMLNMMTARNKDTKIAFNRIPKSRYYNEIAEETKLKWQIKLEKCVKATITKQYFTNVQDRLNMKLNTTPNLAAMMTGHGKTRAYLHRFKLLDRATCVCKKGDQIIDHLLYQCTLFQTHRELLKKNILNNGNWPASKQELITKHRNSFINFINSTDFEHL